MRGFSSGGQSGEVMFRGEMAFRIWGAEMKNSNEPLVVYAYVYTLLPTGASSGGRLMRRRSGRLICPAISCLEPLHPTQMFTGANVLLVIRLISVSFYIRLFRLRCHMSSSHY